MCSRCGCVSEPNGAATVRPAVVEGVLEAGVLVVLNGQDGYGYELASSMTDRNLMPTAVAPARVYDALRRLEADGAVASRDEGSPLGPDRRWYSITPEGRERLARWADALLLTERSLRRLLDTYDTQRTRRPRHKDA